MAARLALAAASKPAVKVFSREKVVREGLLRVSVLKDQFYRHGEGRLVVSTPGFACNARAMATATAERKVKVAVGQMTATGDLDANYRVCARLVEEAGAAGAKFLSLPECFSFIGSRQGEALAIAEPIDGPVMARYKDLARHFGVWLSLGGFQEKGPDERHTFNTHVLLDDSGAVRGVYRKIHLFDLDIPDGPTLKESEFTAPGTEIVSVESPIGRLGLTVCYDLRFPELYENLRYKHNAQVLLVPSAFTKKTGEAHWELLLRARAIETQCYVIAAAQAGVHNEKRESWGDAMIIDPWGVVIARCADRLVTGIAIADIDLNRLDNIRTQMPVETVRHVRNAIKDLTFDGEAALTELR